MISCIRIAPVKAFVCVFTIIAHGPNTGSMHLW